MCSDKTALILCASMGFKNLLQKCLEWGAKIDIQDTEGNFNYLQSWFNNEFILYLR